MNTEHIPYIIETAKCGSINKAAQNLYISQPYLSTLIKHLEKEIGFSIFIRTKSGVLMTKDGEIFLSCIKIMSGQLEKILRISTDKNNPTGLSIMSFRYSLFTHLFLDFRKHNISNNENDTLTDGNLTDVFENISSGNVRLGFVSINTPIQENINALMEKYGLQFIPLCSPRPYGVLMKINHALSCYSKITKKALSAFPHVLLNNINKEEYFKILNLDENPKTLLVSDRGSYFDVLNSGTHIAIATENSEYNKKGSQYIWRPFTDSINEDLNTFKSQIVCVKNQNYTLTLLEKELLDFMKERLKS